MLLILLAVIVLVPFMPALGEGLLIGAAFFAFWVIMVSAGAKK
jgi:hypothetical protein